jgi:hypothetical protein
MTLGPWGAMERIPELCSIPLTEYYTNLPTTLIRKMSGKLSDPVRRGELFSLIGVTPPFVKNCTLRMGGWVR